MNQSESSKKCIDQLFYNQDSERLIYEYIRENKNSGNFYQIIQNILQGSLIMAAFGSNELIKSDKEQTSNYEIFFDSDLILSLIGLHFPEYCQPARELLDLVKINGLHPKIFNFTIDEIKNMLYNCSNKISIFKADIRVDSICSFLKSKGLKKEEIQELIPKINTMISDLGIDIEYYDIDIKNYYKDKTIVDDICKYKPHQPALYRSHDIAAIESIINKRKNKIIKQIENSKAIFLTRDYRLEMYNKESRKHNQNGTIPEVIGDRLLTNILWLKNPQMEVSVNSLISACAAAGNIKDDIWEKFILIANDLYKNREIEEVDLATMLYNDQIKDILAPFQVSDESRIDSKFVLGDVLEKIWKDQELKRNYEMKYPIFERLEEEAKFIIKNALKSSDIKIHDISSRVKKLDSLIKKMEQKKTASLEIITDIVGIRVVCLFLSDIERIGEMIRKNFNILSEDNKIENCEISSFGYASIHFIAQLKDCSGPRYDQILGISLEIQVRTIAMDAWANISHYIDYKKDTSMPRELERDLSAISALFYLADTNFEYIFRSRLKKDQSSSES